MYHLISSCDRWLNQAVVGGLAAPLILIRDPDDADPVPEKETSPTCQSYYSVAGNGVIISTQELRNPMPIMVKWHGTSSTRTNAVEVSGTVRWRPRLASATISCPLCVGAENSGGLLRANGVWRLLLFCVSSHPLLPSMPVTAQFSCFPAGF